MHPSRDAAAVPGFFFVSLRAIWLILCCARSASMRPAVCSERSGDVATLLSWESEGLITISPPIFDLQVRLMGCALRLDGGRLDLMSCQR